MSFGPIPIITAVTGHRDLLDQDLDIIRETLKKEFLTLRKQCPDSRIQLLCGLAEGADWLAAEAALSAGFELITILPVHLEAYEQDFDTPEKLEHFRKLLHQSTDIRLASTEGGLDNSARNKYVGLGRYFSAHAQILYAIWDGDSEGALPGGTADVVRMCKEGAILGDNVLASPEICRIRHLRCRRAKKPDPAQHNVLNCWVREDDIDKHRWQEIAHSIDTFNKRAIHLCSQFPDEIRQRREWLVGEKDHLGQIEATVNLFAIADTLASRKQAQRNNALWFISALACASILFQQIHLGPDMQWHWLILHAALGIAAFVMYRFFFTGKANSECCYLDWRALAEGLRVQTFWQAAGMQRCASNYYLNNQLDELAWIRHAIRSVPSSPSSNLIPPNFQWINDHWLTNQYRYFEKGRNGTIEKRKQYIRWKLVSRGFFLIGTSLTIGLIPASLSGLNSIILSWLSFVAAMTFVVAGIARNYSNQMAFEEHAKRYSKMGKLFLRASRKLTAFEDAKDLQPALALLKAIGNEALVENAEWLLMHRQRKFELPT